MKPRPGIQRLAIVVVALFVIAGIVLVALDWREMRSLLGQASWPWLLPALLFTSASYACLSYSSVIVFRSFGIDLGMAELLRIGFVANAVTFLLNVGGVTGVSLQFVLMKRRGLPAEDILAASFFQLYFSGLMLVVLLPAGLFSLRVSSPSESSLWLAVAAGVLTLLLVVATLIVFYAPLRSFFFRLLQGPFRFVTRRTGDSELKAFETTLARGVSLMRLHPRVLVTLLGLAIADWASTVAALWFCFYALGYAPAVGQLLTGFSLGIAAGLVSFVPGGLGVQEGSMAGIYALLGVPLGTAAVAAVLFRVVYYFIPFLVSLSFYRRLLNSPVN
jgi:uncharacterized protein (TIRG00374 family)